MTETSVSERLKALGHGFAGGRCEKCWSDAASMYAAGQGAYDSHLDAYRAAMTRAEDEAAAYVAEQAAAAGAGSLGGRTMMRELARLALIGALCAVAAHEKAPYLIRSLCLTIAVCLAALA